MTLLVYLKVPLLDCERQRIYGTPYSVILALSPRIWKVGCPFEDLANG
jgi:hypothetical protein